jgi:hypothetical protein
MATDPSFDPPISPSARVAWRNLVALGIADDLERVREALVLWCRPSPALSVQDVAGVLAAVQNAAALERSRQT